MSQEPKPHFKVIEKKAGDGKQKEASSIYIKADWKYNQGY